MVIALAVIIVLIILALNRGQTLHGDIFAFP